VDHAPRLRTGGYVIDFWGLGYEIAARMGLIEEINRIGYHMRELRILDPNGRRASGFGTKVFGELTGGRFVTLGRSDLSRLLFEKVQNNVEVIFGDQIGELHESGQAVTVTFEHSGERRFDLVIGADGLHSRVRQLAFGPEAQFEKRLGYAVAAFETLGYRPRDEEVYTIYGAPGRMLGRFALHEDRTLFLFVFTAEPAEADLQEPAAQKALLRKRYGNNAWECSRILDELDRAPELYFDRVSQIHMDRWSRGRVALVGDAAFCVSLLAGQGSALAMTAAYILAGELANAAGDYQRAFQRYEEVLRSFIRHKQDGAARFAGSFAPRTRLGLRFRDLVVHACALPGVTTLAFGRDIVDRLKLPEYRWPRLTQMI